MSRPCSRLEAGRQGAHKAAGRHCMRVVGVAFQFHALVVVRSGRRSSHSSGGSRCTGEAHFVGSKDRHKGAGRWAGLVEEGLGEEPSTLCRL